MTNTTNQFDAPLPNGDRRGRPWGADKTILLDAIYAASTDFAIFAMDTERRVLTWNSGAETIFRVAAKNMIGQSADRIFTAEDIAAGAPEHETATARSDGRAADFRWHLRHDGSRLWADGVMTPIRSETGEVVGYLKILRDATEKKRAESALLETSRRDSLTGLANRVAFQSRLSEACSAASRNQQLVSLLLLDLDKFKEINDTYGHGAGDQFLQAAGKRMRSATRDTDYIARLGGDEFVVIQTAPHAPHEGAVLAEKLVAALAAPVDIDQHAIHSGVSIGVTVFPVDGTTPERLLKNADLAMYQVKKNGGNGYQYFTEHLDREAHLRSRNLAALRQAVATRNFHLVYQPQINAASGHMDSVEALLRCDEAGLADQPIGMVIQLAAASGMVVEIGIWMVRQACAQLKAWRDAGMGRFTMGINLCTQELISASLLEQIDILLDEFSLSGSDLEIEITERALLEQKARGIATLHALRQRGITTALDDFGTGYSSLAYLRDLPVDKVKLDQSFLLKIPADPDSCAMATAIVHLVHALRRKITIEGVEFSEQAEFFRDLGSELLQGFYFSPPLDPHGLAKWLADRPTR